MLDSNERTNVANEDDGKHFISAVAGSFHRMMNKYVMKMLGNNQEQISSGI